MSFCPKCGSKLTKEVKYCPKCGTSLIDKIKTENRSNTHVEEQKLSDSSASTDEVKGESSKASVETIAPGKPKSNRSKRLSIAVVLLLIALSGVFYYFTQSTNTTEAEEIFSVELAAGYWIAAESDDESISSEGFVSEELTLALYIDSEHVIIARDGEETVESYTITSLSENPEDSTLEIEVETISDEEETLNLIFSLYDDGEQSVSLDILEDKSYTLLKVTEEVYMEAGGSALSQSNVEEETVSEDEVEEASDINETDDISLEEVEGYYVNRDDNGVISEINFINEEFVSLVMIHPFNYTPVAYGANQIIDSHSEGNKIELDVLTVDHHSIRENMYMDHFISLAFTLKDKGHTVQWNDSEEEYVLMDVEDISRELRDTVEFDFEAMLTSLYEDDLIRIINEGTKFSDSTDSAEDTEEFSLQTFWGTYTKETLDDDGYTERNNLIFQSIKDIDSIYDEIHGEHTQAELESLEIIGIVDTFFETDNPMAELGGVYSPYYISSVDYNESTQHLTFTFSDSIGIHADPMTYKVENGHTLIDLENDQKRYELND